MNGATTSTNPLLHPQMTSWPIKRGGKKAEFLSFGNFHGPNSSWKKPYLSWPSERDTKEKSFSIVGLHRMTHSSSVRARLEEDLPVLPPSATPVSALFLQCWRFQPAISTWAIFMSFFILSPCLEECQRRLNKKWRDVREMSWGWNWCGGQSCGGKLQSVSAGGVYQRTGFRALPHIQLCSASHHHLLHHSCGRQRFLCLLHLQACTAPSAVHTPLF